MAFLRRRNKDIAVGARSGQPVAGPSNDEACGEERSPFGLELEEKWAEAWRQARRADLR
jgi:hypothetical protein